PYKLLPTTAGELNAIFTGALESGELRLTRPQSIKFTPLNQLEQLKVILDQAPRATLAMAQPQPQPSVETLAFNTSVPQLDVNTAAQLRNWFSIFRQKQPALPPQVLVWYLQSDYNGYV